MLGSASGCTFPLSVFVHEPVQSFFVFKVYWDNDPILLQHYNAFYYMAKEVSHYSSFCVKKCSPKFIFYNEL